MNMEEKKVSIIIPLYNTEKYIERCLKSVCNQTYNNIEIIVVDDGCTDKSVDIVKSFMKTDERIKICTHEKDKGLYQARITGVENAAGEYIGFVDSDDFISCDFIRSLVYRALETEADVVVGKIVHEDENGYRYIHNLYHYFDFGILEGQDIIKAYWQQEGRCFIWHTIWNKMYSRKIWEQALPVLKKQKKHLIMTEDFVFSSVLLNYANRLASVDFGTYYYYQHNESSTSLNGSVSKFKKNINDLKTAFDFVYEVITNGDYKINISDKFKKWSDLYRIFWQNNIEYSQLSPKEKNEMHILLNESLTDNGTVITAPSFFYSVTTEYDNRYDDLINKIASDTISCVSFDIFNTAVLRPLYKPSDLFAFLNSKFRNVFPNEERSFSDIRILAERDLRKDTVYCAMPKCADVKLTEIYDRIREISDIPDSILSEMMQTECELEFEFCRRRKSIYNAYQVALHCQKRVFFTSDMYLDKETIRKILNDCGYKQFEELLVSSSESASKNKGTLYEILKKKCNVHFAWNILHIGDNWFDDVEKARDAGLATHFYPSPLDCIQFNISDVLTTHSCCTYTEPSGSIINTERGIDFIGVRSALAVAANKIYDNPFISFNEYSEFNCSPKFLGYYAVGMHLLGFTKWFADIINENGYETALFIARDGYLPMKAYEIIKKYYKQSTCIKYLITSRKASFACGIKEPSDMYAVYDQINHDICTPAKLLEMLSPILKESTTDILAGDIVDFNVPFSDYSDFCKFSGTVVRKLFDYDKCENYNQSVAKYFSSLSSGKTCCVDVGYSGRTQKIIKKITGKSCDAFYVHINDDKCGEFERNNNFKVYSYYDYTPAITGGIREVIFSEYRPSCIGYSTSKNEAEPLFEDFEYEYTAYYVINEIQKYALDFIQDYCDFFGKYLYMMDIRSIDISYPYEYLLHNVTEVDMRMFDSYFFEDDMYAGTTQKITEYWKKCLNYHRVIPFYKREEPTKYVEKDNYIDGKPEYKVYMKNKLYEKSLPIKAIYWFIADRDFFKKRLRDYINRQHG